MTIILQYVDKMGMQLKCFIDIEHVASTTLSHLKAIMVRLLSKHGLSMYRFHVQDYDGVSNM